MGVSDLSPIAMVCISWWWAMLNIFACAPWSFVFLLLIEMSAQALLFCFCCCCWVARLLNRFLLWLSYQTHDLWIFSPILCLASPAPRWSEQCEMKLVLQKTCAMNNCNLTQYLNKLKTWLGNLLCDTKSSPLQHLNSSLAEGIGCPHLDSFSCSSFLSFCP